ncbi:hypothetical protein ACHAWF_003952 [Thalassiosira exigua]
MEEAAEVYSWQAGISTGMDGCSCIDASDILATLDDRACITTAGGQKGVMLTAEGPCVPFSYGSNVCRAYDAIYNPECETSGVMFGQNLELCLAPFCYVDAEACRTSSAERLYRSTYFPQNMGIDLFYSFTTCDPSLDDWKRNEQNHTLGGVTIKAAVPAAYFSPFAYKRDLNGEILKESGNEYYNDDIPFEGALIDYLHRLQAISGGDFNVTYTHASRASSLVHPDSAYTAVVQDIEDGLVDMG